MSADAVNSGGPGVPSSPRPLGPPGSPGDAARSLLGSAAAADRAPLWLSFVAADVDAWSGGPLTAIYAQGDAAHYAMLPPGADDRAAPDPGTTRPTAAPESLAALLAAAAAEPHKLPMVQLGESLYADVVLLRDREHVHALLLDRSDDAVLRQQLQQRARELELLRASEQRAMDQLKREQAWSERLLKSIFPRGVMDQLRAGETTIAEEFTDATVLVAGIADWPFLTRGIKPAETVDLLAGVFAAFDALCAQHGVSKIKTIGDVYIAIGGVGGSAADHPRAVAELALAMQRTIVGFSTPAGEPLSLRAGVDIGPVVAGVVGTSRVAYEVWGPPVDTARQMEQFGVPGAIQVSGRAERRLAAAYAFDRRGTFYISGYGEVTTFLLRGGR